jgi:protein TonB
MARAPQAFRFRRPLAAAGVVALHAALIALLLRPMLLPAPTRTESLILVDVPTPPPPAPPPAPPPELPAPPKPEAAAAPPAPRKRPRPIAAPTPPVPAPNPVASAPADGTDTSAGAATTGTGTGASGAGAGAGSGGSGPGGGVTRARWKSGRIDRRDYPPDASRAGIQGSVTVTLDIAPDGRVAGCRIARSSGSPSLDRTTCALIEQRFRFEPARDTAGNAVPGVAGWRQDWWLEPPR